MEEEKLKSILKWTIMALLAFIVIMLTFGLGMFVGQKRADFSFQWAENYHRNFGGPKNGLFGNFPNMDFINSHGIFGPVISVNGEMLIIKGQDAVEKTVVVSNETTIVNGSRIARASDLKVNDVVVVIGSPNEEGQIEAKLIRILPRGTSLIKNLSYELVPKSF